VYDPYGKATVYDGTWTNTVSWPNGRKNALRFCGYRYDALTGLYHVRRRVYHPALGRWLERDPGPGGTSALLARRDPLAAYADGMNAYQYGRSAPTGSTDPLGLQTTRPATDTTRACCKYSKEYQRINLAAQWGIGEPYYWETRRVQKDERNTFNSLTPEICCKCSNYWRQHGLAPWREHGTTWRLRLDEARWKACCWCRMYKLRGVDAEGNTKWWPSHVHFLMECDDHKSAYGHFYFSTTAGITAHHRFAAGSVAPMISPIPWWKPHLGTTWGVVKKVEISCDAFEPVKKEMQKWEQSPPVYVTLFQDCQIYVDILIRIGISAGYGRE